MALEYDWSFWARRNQVAPDGDWSFWLVLAGRGFGKTLAGAKWTIAKAWEHPGCHIALVGATAPDVRKTMLSAETRDVAGMSGLLARGVSPPWFYPEYEPSKKLLAWPNGSIASIYTAEEPERLRGPQHHYAWADEIAAWQRAEDAWDQLMFGLRLGANPQACITTTPKPLPIVRRLVKEPACVVTRGTTYDNKANLSKKFFDSLMKKYEGSRLGRQELMAEILDDVPGALWTRALLERCQEDSVPELWRIVIAIDPAATSGEDSAETGIIAAGHGVDGRGHVIGDYSIRGAPHEWANRAIAAYRHHQADCLVAEANNGGEMVRAVIHAVDPGIPVVLVYASRGKQTRAEPIATLYEQGHIRHAQAAELTTIEDQMCTWAPGLGIASPDRVDALVWAMWKLFVEPGGEVMVHEDRVQVSAY